MNFTHMGNKVSGKTGGTLRRGWTTQAEGSGAEGLDSKSAVQFVDTLKVNHFGDTYVIEVRNSVEYASYMKVDGMRMIKEFPIGTIFVIVKRIISIVLLAM